MDALPLFDRIPATLFRPLAATNHRHYWAVLCRLFDQLWGDEGIETDTQWNYKAVGRYLLPYEIGFSGSWKVQSGFNYAAWCLPAVQLFRSAISLMGQTRKWRAVRGESASAR